MTLVLENVSKTVAGQVHIAPTDLTLNPGTMNVLLGPTLAGKTSLMRLMAGLDAPTSGRIHWNGEDVTGRRVQDRGVAMVYQQFINYPSMTTYDNIASPLRLLRKSKAEIDAAVREAAELMRLTPFLDRKPLELSGGQQQRCALARALVKEAGLVLLDEPLANLDYKLREELRAEIPRIFEEAGSIFVYATTEPEEALLLGGNVAVLRHGRIEQFGPTAQVYRKPMNAVAAHAFSDPPMNFVDCEVFGGRLVLGGRSVLDVDLADQPYSAGFRAHHLTLAPTSEAAVQFRARVVATEITGSETFVHLNYDRFRWVGLLHGVRALDAGNDIDVFVDPAQVFVFYESGALAYSSTWDEAA